MVNRKAMTPFSRLLLASQKNYSRSIHYYPVNSSFSPQAGKIASGDFLLRSNRTTRQILKKSPATRAGFFNINAWQCPTFTWGDPTLSSAQSVFTSEFGMGSGGTRSLWPPGKLVKKSGSHRRCCLLPNLQECKPLGVVWSSLTGN